MQELDNKELEFINQYTGQKLELIDSKKSFIQISLVKHKFKADICLERAKCTKAEEPMLSAIFESCLQEP
jgi:hypothetical protein